MLFSRNAFSRSRKEGTDCDCAEPDRDTEMAERQIAARTAKRRIVNPVLDLISGRFAVYSVLPLRNRKAGGISGVLDVCGAVKIGFSTRIVIFSDFLAHSQ